MTKAILFWSEESGAATKSRKLKRVDLLVSAVSMH